MCFKTRQTYKIQSHPRPPWPQIATGLTVKAAVGLRNGSQIPRLGLGALGQVLVFAGASGQHQTKSDVET
jgi:hypothetical protein